MTQRSSRAESTRPIGRCIGCRTTDWPTCKGCGADLSAERLSGPREPEVGAAGQERDDELVEADALLCGALDEERVQGGRHPDEDLAAGFHAADSSAYAIDKGDSACDTACMPKMKLAVRMEIDVDQAAWREEYGTTGSALDVDNYLLNTLQQCPAAEAGGLKITGFAVQEA